MRYWLVELPARITEVLGTWYRLYFTVIVIVAAVILPAMLLISLVLSLFGIRWGW